MENATEALYMAFAVMILTIALTVSIVSFTNAKETADAILYTKDESNYYEYQRAIGKADENRIVGLETIIPTLYKYYKENYTVIFREGRYNENTGDFDQVNYYTVYKTSSILKKNWQASYKNLMDRKYQIADPNEEIFSFDLDEETLRHEPWTGSYERIKNNLDCFLKGDKYINPNNNMEYIDYSKGTFGQGGFIGWCNRNNARFVETISEYDYSSIIANDTDESAASRRTTYTGAAGNNLTKEKSKRMIIFTLIN